MEKTHDGFRIAEEDLDIRGPGEFFGTRQSGLPDFRVGHILRDSRILAEARREAFDLLESDPELENIENRSIRAAVIERWKGRLELGAIA
jgi:ATP-dependent DNA helicase RecG